MAKKAQRAIWFKFWLRHRALFDAVPDPVAGRALKAALYYFDTGLVPSLDQLEMVVFSSIRADIDEANSEYQRDVENGRKGGRPSKEKPPVREGNLPLPRVPQAEVEAEAEAEAEAEVELEVEVKREGIPADMPPPRHSFFPPSLEEVKQYCREQGYSMNAEHFMDHYESNGWMVGKNRMRSWKAAVRNWNRKEQTQYGKTGSEQVRSGIGTVL